MGDRYFAGAGTFSKKLEASGNGVWELTLIETEQVGRFDKAVDSNFVPSVFRRNLGTEGVSLNDLVDHRFFIGSVELEGIRLCEPCAHLASLVSDSVLPNIAGMAGLRARILTDGKISVCDRVSAPVS